jgi:hypothetical protein
MTLQPVSFLIDRCSPLAYVNMVTSAKRKPMEIPMSKKKVSTKRGVKIETVLQVQHPAWEQRL